MYHLTMGCLMLHAACVDMPIGYVEPIHLINDTSKV